MQTDKPCTRFVRTQGEVFEMLLTLSDFDSFKELMLAYKSVRIGASCDRESLLGIMPPHAAGTDGAQEENFKDLGVSVLPAEIHFNEQEEGEARAQRPQTAWARGTLIADVLGDSAGVTSHETRCACPCRRLPTRRSGRISTCSSGSRQSSPARKQRARGDSCTVGLAPGVGGGRRAASD